MKLVVALAVAVILLVTLIAISNRVQEEPIEPQWPPDDNETITPPPLPGEDQSELQFEFTEGSCASHQQPEVTIELEGKKIVFSGFALTLSQCYALWAEKTLEGDELVIEIETILVDEACIGCSGEIPFSGKVTGLIPGTYNVEIISKETTLAQETITILEAPVRPDYPCETVDDCEGLDPLIKCLGYWICSENKCEYKCGIPAPEGTCTSDSDCGTGGCSGQICGFKEEVEGIITTCEWVEEYGCLQETECGCVDGTCKWVENEGYIDCISNLQD